MTIIIICLSVYLIWTILGCWFFLSIMGQKFRKERWYDRILITPVMPIAYFIGWLSKK